MPAKSITRGKPAEAIAAAPHRVKGRTTCGQQEQFYLEGQIAYAVPREDGQMTIYVSTQHPDGNQREAAAALNLYTHDVEVICRRWAASAARRAVPASSARAALAAFARNRPVKLRANRDDDMTITGKRHDFRIDYEAGFDDEGRILPGWCWLRVAGYSTDYSGPVNDRAILHIDNRYYHAQPRTSSGTAARRTCRAPPHPVASGGPQGMFGIETVIDDIARQLGHDPLEVRRINLYQDPAVSGDPAA